MKKKKASKQGTPIHYALKREYLIKYDHYLKKRYGLKRADEFIKKNT
jgi:hypothetical protein